MLGVVLIPDGILQYFTSNVFRWPVSGFASFGSYVFPQDRQLLGCFFGRWFLIIPCSFSSYSDLAARSGCSFSLRVCSLLATRLPLRQVFFWPAILTPRYPVSGTPLPLRHDFFWPAILTPRSPFSGTPGPSFRSLFWYPWSSASTPSFFPPNLPFPVSWVAGSLLCRLAVRLRFLPLRGFYRSAVFTAQRFLPLRGFYRSAFAGFLGALLFRRPHACCPPVFTHFRAARSLCAALRYACVFYRSAVFTAPRFLPLRGFYRSAVFTAPRFLPLCGFYRSAVFTAPRFLPLRLRRFFGGSALPPPSCLLPPSLRPLPGAPCGAGSSVASPVGRHSWPSFCTACLTTLGALPLISPVPLLCISYKLRDRRSSRLLSVGTRAPRVLPPPSGTSRRMEIRHFHHRLTEVPSVDMLIEAWNGSIYRWHGVSLWCGFLHIPQIHAPPVPETR